MNVSSSGFARPEPGSHTRPGRGEDWTDLPRFLSVTILPLNCYISLTKSYSAHVTFLACEISSPTRYPSSTFRQVSGSSSSPLFYTNLAGLQIVLNQSES